MTSDEAKNLLRSVRADLTALLEGLDADFGSIRYAKRDLLMVARRHVRSFSRMYAEDGLRPCPTYERIAAEKAAAAASEKARKMTARRQALRLRCWPAVKRLPVKTIGGVIITRRDFEAAMAAPLVGDVASVFSAHKNPKALYMAAYDEAEARQRTVNDAGEPVTTRSEYPYAHLPRVRQEEHDAR